MKLKAQWAVAVDPEAVMVQTEKAAHTVEMLVMQDRMDMVAAVDLDISVLAGTNQDILEKSTQVVVEATGP